MATDRLPGLIFRLAATVSVAEGVGRRMFRREIGRACFRLT
jgi:hypothetical protein